MTRGKKKTQEKKNVTAGAQQQHQTGVTKVGLTAAE